MQTTLSSGGRFVKGKIVSVLLILAVLISSTGRSGNIASAFIANKDGCIDFEDAFYDVLNMFEPLYINVDGLSSERKIHLYNNNEKIDDGDLTVIENKISTNSDCIKILNIDKNGNFLGDNWYRIVAVKPGEANMTYSVKVKHKKEIADKSINVKIYVLNRRPNRKDIKFLVSNEITEKGKKKICKLNFDYDILNAETYEYFLDSYGSFTFLNKKHKKLGKISNVSLRDFCELTEILYTKRGNKKWNYVDYKWQLKCAEKNGKRIIKKIKKYGMKIKYVRINNLYFKDKDKKTSIKKHYKKAYNYWKRLNFVNKVYFYTPIQRCLE